MSLFHIMRYKHNRRWDSSVKKGRAMGECDKDMTSVLLEMMSKAKGKITDFLSQCRSHCRYRVGTCRSHHRDDGKKFAALLSGIFLLPWKRFLSLGMGCDQSSLNHWSKWSYFYLLMKKVWQQTLAHADPPMSFPYHNEMDRLPKEVVRGQQMRNDSSKRLTSYMAAWGIRWKWRLQNACE